MIGRLVSDEKMEASASDPLGNATALFEKCSSEYQTLSRRKMK